MATNANGHLDATPKLTTSLMFILLLRVLGGSS
jgi:hypothetical protein